MATPIGFDPSTWNSTTAAPFTVGAVYTFRGFQYRYVQVVTAACSLGAVMCRYDALSVPSGKVIGANRTTALTGTPAALIVVGVGVGDISINNYGFILVSGVHPFVKSTSSTLGNWQKASGTNDTCTDATASIARSDGIFGIALSSTSGGLCQVDLRGLV